MRVNTVFDKINVAWNGKLDKSPLFWGVLFFAMLFKYGYYGFTYFPTVDDHNMYGIYSMMSPLESLLRYDMYTTRPLASLLDTYVISRLWGNLWIVLLLFTFLHFISTYLICEILKKNNIKTGAVLAIIFSLMPLGNDATYWIAASSRIVIGLFFAVLSFFLYLQYIEKSNERKPHIALYITGFALTNLISLGFYEQIIAFSFVGILLLMLFNLKRQKNKWISVIPFINIAIIGSYYLKFSNSGNMASRGQLLSSKYILHTTNVLKRIKELMIIAPGSLIKHGTLNGLQLLITDRAVAYTLIAILLSAALGLFYAREKVSGPLKTSIIKLVIGLFFIFLPFAPFFILQKFWIVYRNTFVSIIGIGLVAESLIGLFFYRWDPKAFRGIAAGIAVFVFLLGNAAEINDYRSISMIDREIVTHLSDTLQDASDKHGNKNEVIVFNTKSSYITPTSKHFTNCTAAGWALTGAFRSILRQPVCQNTFTPIVAGYRMSVKRDALEQSIFIGIDSDRRTFLLHGNWKSDSELELMLENEKLFGTVKVFENDSITFTLQ